MKNCTFPHLKIGDITARVPVIQGGMGVGISMSRLATAVAREGAIGVLAAVHIGLNEPDFSKNPRKATYRALEKQIQEVKEAVPDGIVGVNIMVALTDYDRLVRIAAEAGADLIISGAGLPLKLPQLLPPGSSTKLVPIVSSARAAAILCKRWGDHFDHPPDALVVEGPLAGGHLGFHEDELDKEESRVENILVQVVETVRPFEEKWGMKIPVIAAGGIFTGADIHAALSLGAAGVQMGTRFVATEECDASRAFKEAYISASPEDITIIKSPVGMPGRAIKGPFLEKVARGEARPKRCPYKCLKTCDYKKVPYCISDALISAQRGDFEHGFVFSGANAWRVEKIVTVKELVAALEQEYCEALEGAG